jgi:putative beta-lysine N-acetyltransferase
MAVLGLEDTEDISQIYKRVFKTYPFPIHNPAYIEETMNDNVVYFGIRDKGQLIAVSSCEMDMKSQNVEMTDFATLPEYRSQGLASSLLYEMENAMRQRGIMTAYTIARAVSHGMNITFAKHNYTFSGTLINNTDISGEIESMNVWYKAL